MRILELSLRNYRVFEEVELELPSQVIGIFGPNGAGKSTLMESVAVGLYGVGAARTKKQEIRTHGLLTDCDVRLVFEHAGQQYEVRRSLKGRGHMPEAELYGGDLLLASGVTEVDAEVQRLLHMDLGVFRASVYAEQKQLDAFSEFTPGKRKEMALRLLGIRPVDDARKAARADTRSAKELATQLAGAVADIAALEADLKEAGDRAREATGLAKTVAGQLKDAQTRAKKARKGFDALDADRQRAEKLRVAIDAALAERAARIDERDALEVIVDELDAHLARLPALQEDLAALEGVEQRLRAAEHAARAALELARVDEALGALPRPAEDLGAARDAAELAREEAREAATRAAGDRARAEETLAAALARVQRAGDADPSQPCPTCGQPLGEGFGAYMRHVKAEAAAAKKALAQAERDARTAVTARDRTERTWTVARDAAESETKAADERVRLTAEVARARSDLAEATAQFGGEVPDVAPVQGEYVRAQELGREVAALAAEGKHQARAVRDLVAANAKIAKLDGDLASLTANAEHVSFDPDAYSAALEELREADAVLEAARHAEREAADARAAAEKEVSGLEGRLLEARETERRVGALRSDARYLERTAMLLDGFRDHLVARVGPELSREAEALFRDLTNHEYEDLKIDEETLSIQIADGETYFPVERFSGSETDLANLALRVAISTHLSRVSGADLGMLVLDEVLASLDQERKDLMVRTMGRLAGRFHQLFVITHAEQVKDQFPACIQIEKSSRRRSTATLV